MGGSKTKYPHKSCAKWRFFEGRGWYDIQYNYHNQLYKEMKRFGRAAITTLYNAQTNLTRKAWCEPEVQLQTEEALHQLLNMHPDRVCRRLLAESDMILLKHITYHAQKEFREHRCEHFESGKYIDGEWIPEVYAEVLEGLIRTLDLADENADSIDHANGDGLNDASDFNTFSPNASSPSPHSPHLDSNSNIEGVDAMGDLELIHRHYTSQDSDVSPQSLNHAVIEPNLKTTVNRYDIQFSMGTSVGVGVPLPDTHRVDQNPNTTDSFVSPSSRNDTHWNAFVDTKPSDPVEDIDTILRNATAANTQPTVQAPHTIPLHDTFLDWNHGFDADILEHANIAGDSLAAPLNAQPAMQVPDINPLNNASMDAVSWWGSVDFDSLPGGNTSRNEHANVSAVPMPYYLLSTNANANDIGGYYSVGRGIRTSPNGSGNAASYLPLGTLFDREWNVAWGPNIWTAMDWTNMDRRLPDHNAPRAGYQDYNIDLSPADLNHPDNPYQPSTFPTQSPGHSP